ncbi:uncharacterized protein LOC126737470 [Anthonomus grandis grandis]|uniref:uncharacterized protein LOC126737470 n=1 Tax=Anthonomus grandis grandis TaxID=2921223 RepID=UPI002164F5E4|nr:uncharacterized protein LOC126737470 [Anthonomus grandis grandis]
MKGNASRIMMFLTSLMGSISYSSAFWFSSSVPEVPKSEPSPRLLYSDSFNNYKQYMPSAPPIYTVPFPVPLPAQLSPASVQNVQLVPCLCPITQEYPYENKNDVPARKNNGAFVQTTYSNLGQFAPAGQYQNSHITHSSTAQRK